MQEDIVQVKGKKYNVKQDISYFDAKQFIVINDECKQGKYKFPNDEMLKILIPAVCPEIKLNFKDMSIDGERLSFVEVLQLTEILTNKLNLIIEGSLKYIGASNVETAENTNIVKNEEKAIEDVT